jgi:cysteine desulfurase
MGVSPDEALGTVRLTLGRGTTEDEVVRAAEALVRAWRVSPAGR